MRNRSLKIYPLISEKSINPNLYSTTKEEAIKEIIELVNSDQVLTDKSKFLNLIIERENLCSTGLENGVAFLHPRVAVEGLVNKTTIGIGISRKGIDFNSADEELTYVFFILCFKEYENHLQYLSYLSRLCKDIEFINNLKSADNFKEIIKIIDEKEKSDKSAGIPPHKTLYDGIMSFYQNKK
ncbi:MAG: PTS sugar transporter subunit IIA [bacterium]|nr:PTS sugar transporter subunit IIA [bacterium]